MYRATQLGMNRDVAVKLLHAAGPAAQDSKMRERFKREAMMARNLNHPHTIRQYDFGETDAGMMYLVLEFLDGKNLVETIRESGALGDERVRRLAEGALKSLAEAHAQGIVHRDLKPANIMLCNIYGERDYVKVLDFGIAKTVMGDTDLTAAGVALGSPRYMAPELLRGEQPNPASDVYAIAITFAEAIMGKPLLKAENSVEAAQVQLSDDPLPIPGELRDSELWPWLSIALQKDEEQRYESAEEMLEYLSADPEALARRGADFGEESVQTLPYEKPSRDELATLSDGGPMDDELQTLSDEDSLPDDDEHAPTMKLDSSAVDDFITSNERQTTEEQSVPEEELDQTNPRDPVSEDEFDTSPSRPALPTPTRPGGSGPRFQIGEADQERRTAPLSATNGPPPQEEQTADSVPRHSLFTEEGSGDTDAPTEMVALEESTHPEDTGSGPSGGLRPGMDTPRQPFDGPGSGPRHDPSGQDLSQPDLPRQFDGLPTPESGTGQALDMGQFDQHSNDSGGRQAFGQAGSGPQPNFGSQPAPPPKAPPKESNRKLLLGLAVLLTIGILGLGAIAFVAVRVLDDDKSAAPQPNVEEATEQPATTDEPRVVEFKIFTAPPKAELLIDGESMGVTPAKFTMSETRLPLDVNLKLDGYEARTVTLAADGATTFDLKLDQVEGATEEEVDEPAEEEEAVVEEKPEPRPDPEPDVRPDPKPDPKPEKDPEEKKPLIQIWD